MASIERRETTTGTVYRVRFRHAGKQQAVTFSDPVRAEAWCGLAGQDPAAALRLLEAPTTSTPTVAEWLGTHIDMLTGVTDGSRREYRSYVEHDVAPHPIGLVPVGDLARADVAGWVQWLQKTRSLAGKTIANRHGFMSAAIASAVDAGHAKTNPCRGMRLPRTSHTQEEHVYLTRDEFERLHGLIPEHYRPLVMVLVGTGMRLGEATALQVGDVDTATRSIRVRRAWKRTGKSQTELGPTKTRRSDRTVAAPPQVLAALAPLMDGRHPTATLLLNRRGGQIKQAAMWKVWRVAVAEFAGDVTRVGQDSRGRPVMEVVEEGPGKHPRIHDLRHTFASWAIQAGLPLPVIQRQLGHESITTTVDTYGHLARADFDALGSATAAMLPAIGSVWTP